MTRKKTTKKKAVALPERKYFTLETVADEWQTDVDHVLELLEEGEIIPSVTLEGLTGYWWKLTNEPAWDEEHQEWEIDGENVGDRWRGERVKGGTWYLPAFSYGPIFVDDQGGRYLKLEHCFLSADHPPPSNDQPTHWLLPRQEVTSLPNPKLVKRRVELRDLLISKEEKERFLDKHNLHEGSPENTEAKEAAPKQHASKGIPNASPEEKRLLTEKEAAAYIGMSRSFLKQGRYSGPVEGRTPPPPFVELEGRAIRYLKEDLDNWIARYPRRLSTHLEPLGDEEK